MAVNFQTSTLCLTLPISCQICLGKVKQPVICANHHVFCSCCMEMWLKKANQCPTCRVPITAENPCREIIGGTNESDHNQSPATRKCLRKTRGELLFREYEEEIEGLIRENEDLKSRNQSLESQLKTALDPGIIISAATDDGRVDPAILEEWKNKLRAATDVCEKVKQDMEKLKEANKALRSQNIDLVQENMRLKAEVASRSPQKFGRYTVAALEAKIQQYERDVDHLKRALERSDQYVEDLEARLRKSDKKRVEIQEAGANSKAGADTLTQQQKINMMMRSLSNDERGSICSNPEVECRTFSQNPSTAFASSTEHKLFNKVATASQKGDDVDGPSDFLPTTPSSAFRSLTLRSPGVREKRVAFKPTSYLRRLDFDQLLGSEKSGGATANQLGSLDKLPKDSPSNTDAGPVKSVFWGAWQSSKTDYGSLAAPRSESLVTGSAVPVADESSEASMDAAYLDKISELDSMMLDGDSSSSRGSQLSLASTSPVDLDNTLVPEANTSADGKCAAEHDRHPPCDRKGSGSSKAPWSRGKDGEEGVIGPAAFQAEELSFDLLFDPLEENKASPCGSSSLAGQQQHLENPSSSSSDCTGKPVNTPRDRHTLSTGQPTKRKSHSPFNTSSPTKLSKLM